MVRCTTTIKLYAKTQETGKRDRIMYYCSKNSKRKIFHNSGCRYVKRYDKKNWITFYTADEARSAGYTECNHCSHVGKLYKRDRNKIDPFCYQNALACHMYDGKLWIQTPSSKWFISPVGKHRKLLLYHKNEDPYRESDSESPVMGYHHQEITKNTILEYLKYIAAHDVYRRRNPIKINVPDELTKPRKGTKRWRKGQKRKKRSARRESIKRVLDQIEELEARGGSGESGGVGSQESRS